MKRSTVVVQASGWQDTAERIATTLRASISAIGPLNFDEKRNLICWLCDVFCIDPTKLRQ